MNYTLPLYVGVVILLVLLGVAYISFSSKPQEMHPSPELQKTYATQGECETTLGKPCTLVLCDYIPEGKTFEEVCGRGFTESWVPQDS
jgi:hypothetical protein